MVERHRMSQMRSMLNGSSSEEQLGEMLRHHLAAAGAAAAVTFDAFVGRDLDREAGAVCRDRAGRANACALYSG